MSISEKFQKVFCEEGKRLRSEVLCCNLGIKKLKIRQLVAAVNQGRILPNQNNRGQGNLVPKIYNYIASNPNVRTLDGISLCCCKVNGRSVFIIVDGHNRIYGLCLAFKDGFLTENQLNAEIGVRIIPEKDFFSSYRDANVHFSHTSSNQLLNPDLGFGSVLESFFEVQAKPDQKLLKANCLNLAYIVYALITFNREEQQKMSYSEVFALRNSTKSKYNMVKEEFKSKVGSLSQENWWRIHNSITHYLMVVNQVEDLFKQDQKGPKFPKILKSGPFMGMILWDIIQDFNDFPRNVKPFVSKIRKKWNDLTRLIPGITSSSKICQLDAERNIKDCFKGR